MRDEEMSEKKRKKMNKFVEELFNDKLDLDSLVSLKETIVPTAA